MRILVDVSEFHSRGCPPCTIFLGFPYSTGMYGAENLDIAFRNSLHQWPDKRERQKGPRRGANTRLPNKVLFSIFSSFKILILETDTRSGKKSQRPSSHDIIGALWRLPFVEDSTLTALILIQNTPREGSLSKCLIATSALTASCSKYPYSCQNVSFGHLQR